MHYVIMMMIIYYDSIMLGGHKVKSFTVTTNPINCSKVSTSITELFHCLMVQGK